MRTQVSISRNLSRSYQCVRVIVNDEEFLSAAVASSDPDPQVERLLGIVQDTLVSSGRAPLAVARHGPSIYVWAPSAP